MKRKYAGTPARVTTYGDWEKWQDAAPAWCSRQAQPSNALRAMKGPGLPARSKGLACPARIARILAARVGLKSLALADLLLPEIVARWRGIIPTWAALGVASGGAGRSTDDSQGTHGDESGDQGLHDRSL